MKITDIECHVVVDPNYDPQACSSAQDDIIVLVRTDEGITGIGEVDTNPWVAKAMIEAPGTHCLSLGLKEMLLGADPLNPVALWERMYVGTFMTGRRGVGICAIGAIDMALWDIRGKAWGQPCWRMLGGEKQEAITPYASLLPDGHTLEAYQRSLVQRAIDAKTRGFRAAKMEVCINGPYSHNALQESDEAVVETVAACREAIGPDMTMMVDVCYAWNDPKRALGVIEKLAPYDVFFIETPLQLDDIEGYAFLARHSPIRIAAGELQQTRFEFLDLMDRGHIAVAQPDVGRVGGLTEARRVADLAKERDRLIVPHCWKTAIGVAASAQLAAVTPHCAFIEYLPPDASESVLRRELADDGLVMIDGRIAPSDQPGLGVELNFDALQKYSAGEINAFRALA